MSGLFAACVVPVAASDVAAAEAAASKARKRERKERKEARKKERKRAKGERHERPKQRSKRARSGSDSGSSSDDEGAAGVKDEAKDERREAAGLDWMSNPAHQSAPKPPPVDAAALAKAEEAAAKEARRAALELNPYWALHGDGVPQPADVAPAAAPTAFGAATASAVGDGGASWRLKALKRAQERAAEEGRSLDAVVQERWGTLAAVSEAVTRGTPAAHSRAHLTAKAARLEAEGDAGRAGGGEEGEDARLGGERSYLKDLGREGAAGRRFQTPTAAAPLSWRASGATSGGAREGAAARAGERPGDWKCGASKCGITNFAFRRACHKCGTPAGGVGGAGDGSTAVLGAMARELNAFASDGSFMANAAAAATPAAEAAAPHALLERGGGRGLAAVAAAGEGDAREVIEHEVSDVEEEEAQPRAPVMQPVQQLAPAAHRPPPPPEPGSGNASVAALLRARLLGKQAPLPPPADVVVLPMVLADGRAAPGAFGAPPLPGAAGAADASKRPARLQRHDPAAGVPIGEKARFYGDDDRSLAALVAEEKHGAGRGSGYEANLARNIVKQGGRWKGKELGAEEEYEHEGGLELYEQKRGRGRAPEVEAQRGRAAQVAEFQRGNLLAARCLLCFDNPAALRHLRIAHGTRAYLALPEKGPLVPGHALILPMAHAASVRTLDEDVAEEMRNFKKCLLRMHAAAGRGVLFMETSLGGALGGALGGVPGIGKHAGVEAIPLSAAAAANAPAYFRKAIDEAESEWATHAAKKLIPTGGTPAGLRAAIPPNFPYFHVEFGLREGFVHVIDEPEKWSRTFGRDVLIGLLGLPGELAHARERTLPAAVALRNATEFAKEYGPFDWTAQLNE